MSHLVSSTGASRTDHSSECQTLRDSFSRGAEMEYSPIVLVTVGFVLGFAVVLGVVDVLISYAPEDKEE